MTHEYKDVNPVAFGTTVSCHTLARMLNEIRNVKLSRKVAAHINSYFKSLQKFDTIQDKETRLHVGNLLLDQLDYLPNDLNCPKEITFVIRNVKLAYIKDMFINEVPLNYKRKSDKLSVS